MKKNIIATCCAILLAFAGTAFAEQVTIVSRKLEDKDFSRNYTVTLDTKSVKDKGSYFVAAVKTTVEQKETFKKGETREETRENKYLYAFDKKERKYKIVGESNSISYSGNFDSEKQQSASHSSMSVSESGISEWEELPKEADDILNLLYDKTLEIGGKK